MRVFRPASPALHIAACLGALPLAFTACEVETPDAPAPTKERVRDDFPAEPATTESLGIVTWRVQESTPGHFEIAGVDDEDAIIAELMLDALPSGGYEARVFAPAPGRLVVDAAGVVVEDTLPDAEILRAFASDVGPIVGDDAFRSHTSAACLTASATAAVACAAAWGTGGLAGWACAAALASAAAACGQPHCDQVQCNASCTTAGHTYGWCQGSEPSSCQCYGIGPAGGGGDGGGGGGGGGCTSDWSCPPSQECCPSGGCAWLGCC